MARIAIFPDGMRLNLEQATSWSLSGSAPKVTLADATSYTWSGCPNAVVANLVLNWIDLSFISPAGKQSEVVTVAAFLVSQMLIYTLSPTGGAHGSTFTVTTNGVGFVNGCTVLIGAGPFIPAMITFVNSGQITWQYSNNLSAGTYDVTVRNPNGQQTTYPQSFTLT